MNLSEYKEIVRQATSLAMSTDITVGGPEWSARLEGRNAGRLSRQDVEFGPGHHGRGIMLENGRGFLVVDYHEEDSAWAEEALAVFDQKVGYLHTLVVAEVPFAVLDAAVSRVEDVLGLGLIERSDLVTVAFARRIVAGWQWNEYREAYDPVFIPHPDRLDDEGHLLNEVLTEA